VAQDVVRSVTADVPFGVMDVLFRRVRMAPSAGSVSFSFIHTKDMPVFACFFAGSCRFTLPLFGVFQVSPLPPNALRGGQSSSDR
jgi:hypothetical protein